jgi:hypothetical protein
MSASPSTKPEKPKAAGHSCPCCGHHRDPLAVAAARSPPGQHRSDLSRGRPTATKANGFRPNGCTAVERHSHRRDHKNASPPTCIVIFTAQPILAADLSSGRPRPVGSAPHRPMRVHWRISDAGRRAWELSTTRAKALAIVEIAGVELGGIAHPPRVFGGRCNIAPPHSRRRRYESSASWYRTSRLAGRSVRTMVLTISGCLSHRRLLKRGASFGRRLGTRFTSTSGTAKHLARAQGGYKRDGANSP